MIMDLHYFCQDSAHLYIQYGLPSFYYSADEEKMSIGKQVHIYLFVYFYREVNIMWLLADVIRGAMLVKGYSYDRIIIVVNITDKCLLIL